MPWDAYDDTMDAARWCQPPYDDGTSPDETSLTEP